MDEITTTRLAKLFDTTPKTVADLGKRGIIEKGEKRGTWLLQPSVAGYVRHLRAEAAGRGGEEGATARARLGEAQADLATTRAAKLRGGPRARSVRRAERKPDARASGGADRACR